MAFVIAESCIWTKDTACVDACPVEVYLADYAQHLGATALTFYDDDVVRFFSPHAEGKSAVFLVAIGKSDRKEF